MTVARLMSNSFGIFFFLFVYKLHFSATGQFFFLSAESFFSSVFFLSSIFLSARLSWQFWLLACLAFFLACLAPTTFAVLTYNEFHFDDGVPNL